MNFPERAFVLAHILLHEFHQRFCLLRAEVDALKIVNLHLIRRGLGDAAEHEEEVPQVQPDLHAIGIILTIFGGADQMNLWGGLLSHKNRVSPGGSGGLLWKRTPFSNIYVFA